jgi:hypothetical protein
VVAEENRATGARVVAGWMRVRGDGSCGGCAAAGLAGSRLGEKSPYFLNVLVAFEYGGALFETVVSSMSEAVFEGGNDEGVRAGVCLAPEFALGE